MHNIGGGDALTGFALKRLYKRDALLELREVYASIPGRLRKLQNKWWDQKLKSEAATEFALHGFLRRVKTLQRCIDNAFRLVSPMARNVPSDARLSDAAINIQAFYANLFGAMDNLAWVWVHERGLKIARTRVGLKAEHKELRGTLSPMFQDYLASRDDWMKYVIEYRDALAHRIPLYIPPGTISQKNRNAYDEFERRRMHALYVREHPTAYQSISLKQSKLLVFKPIITHSLTEAQGWYPFHKQMVIDFVTIEEMGNKMLDEINR